MKLTQSKSKVSGNGVKVAIIISRFNDNLGNELLENCRKALLDRKVRAADIVVVKVPGALEIPFLAMRLIEKGEVDVIITLGVVILGDTPHFDYVCGETYRALMELNLIGEIPVIFGVLTVLNEAQAVERVSSKGLNKGQEFAESALEMAVYRKF